MRWVVLVVLAAAAAPLLFTTATYARWWWVQRHEPRGEQWTITWRCAAIVRESLALTMTLIAFRGLPPTRPDARARSGRAAIALVTTGPLGARVLAPLARRLDAHGWPLVHFRPTRWDVSLEDGAGELHAFIRGLHPLTPVTTLIAFGRAGMLVRYCLRRYAVPGVRQVFTLGTPHQGTAALLPPWSAGSRALRPRSRFMQHLAAGDRVPQQFDVTAIASDFDAFIAPSSSAYYPGAFNIEVRGVGHFALARSARAWQLIRENLNPTTASGPPSSAAQP